MYLMTKYIQCENPQSLTANQADPKNRAKFTILRKEGIYVGKHSSIFAIAIIDPKTSMCIMTFNTISRFNWTFSDHIYQQPQKKREV